MPRIRLQASLSGEPEDLAILEGALGPELADELPGVTVDLDRAAPGTVALAISGDRAPQVRAAANAYLGWAKTVEDVLDVAPRSSKE